MGVGGAASCAFRIKMYAFQILQQLCDLHAVYCPVVHSSIVVLGLDWTRCVAMYCSQQLLYPAEQYLLVVNEGCQLFPSWKLNKCFPIK